MNGELHHFACPVCGRARTVSPRALQAITRGQRTGECRTGEGCRQRLTEPERLRRWWLQLGGVTDAQVRRSGGAAAYVLEFGMPDLPRTPPRSMPVETVALIVPPPRRTDHARSKLPSWCYDQADGDPELALALALEIICRGVPISDLITVDHTPTLAA